MIKFTNIQMVEVSDWDHLVEQTYGRPYAFQQQDGCKDRGTFNLTVPYGTNDNDEYENDTISEDDEDDEMGVSFKAWLAKTPPVARSNSFWHRNFYPDVQMVANDLHTKGLLPAGKYTINIDW